ncbi:PHP domain-containing protein [Patescibacteria group bacterium]
MFKLDLHTHSTLSHDGGLGEREYEDILGKGILDYVAVTDHDEIDFGKKLHKKLGDRVIVGEEIGTKQGDLVGLYLKHRIDNRYSVVETTKRIIDQGGVIYVPHPFHFFESSVNPSDIEDILEITDKVIIEVFNARTAYFNRGKLAHAFSEKHNLAKGAGSDTHCKWGIGSAYTSIKNKPSPTNLHKLMSKGVITTKRAPLHSLLCPKINVIRKSISKR